MEITTEAIRSKLSQEHYTTLQEFLSVNMSVAVNDLAAHYPQKKSLEVDFVELSKFNPMLADELLANPDAFIDAAEKILAGLNPQSVITSQMYKPHFRVFNLPDVSLVRVQDLGAASLDKLVKVEGVTSWVTDIYPIMKVSVWECEHCWTITKLTTSKVEPLKAPPICKCSRNKFRLLEEKSEFVNLQRARMQELVERMTGGSPTVHVDAWLEDDLTNMINPGEKLVVCGILRLRPNKDGKGRSSVYNKFLDVLHVYKLQQEFEMLEITQEEERQIRELSAKPNVHELISQSIAPSIYGYKEMKQAIALQLFGGTPGKVLPDGQRIRSDIHTLLVGDPGCLVAGERVALGDGRIVKIETLGQKHLQDIKIQVLTGEGGKKRDIATCFHKYEKQPVIELILESGKRIAGTYNHPLMSISTENGSVKREWKQLNEFKSGDKLQTITSIPCTSKQKLNLVKSQKEFSKKQTIPEVVFSANNNDLKKFLTWLFENYGTLNQELTILTFTSKNKTTLREIQLLLLRFAIYSEIKQNNLIIDKRNSQIPNYEKIIRINKLPPQTVYDIEVPKTHRFIANGIVSHNTAKSSVIQYVMRLAPKAIFTSGKGASGVGLCVAPDSLVFVKDQGIKEIKDVVENNFENPIEEKPGEVSARSQLQILALNEESKLGFKTASKTWRINAPARLIKIKTANGKELITTLGTPLMIKVEKVEWKEAQFLKAGMLLAAVKEIPQEVKQNSEFPTIVWDKVTSAEVFENKDLPYVYDFTVDNTHAFLANGIIVHNTASAEKDEIGGGWILKAGAMVLASGGIIGIDEFDKMEKEDRSALHEAMEQQKISIAKAGIVTTFTARTAVLAAANPKFGRFDPNAPPATQFEIPPTLLSRFDLIFTIKDVIDETKDRKMAEHILLGHTIAAQKLKPADDSAILPEVSPELLRKYIAYARRSVFPILTNEAVERVKSYYLELRQMGKKNNTFPVTARQIEGIIRLSEASAKLRLSDRVELNDAERAVALSEFVLRDIFTDKETGLIDSDIITIGQPKSKIDKVRSLLSIIQSLEKEFDLVDIDDVVKKASEVSIDEPTARKHIDELKRVGDLYEPKPGYIKSARKKDTW